MANTCRILSQLVRMATEFILVFIDTKNAMKLQELAEKSQFIQKSTQNGLFWPKYIEGGLYKML